jgi:hypothetical protein
MPSWVQHSDVQTVQWLNDILEKLWPSISSATEAVIMQTLQPILDQNCPSYLTSLEFSRITLGTIAPVIVGVRHCRTTAEDNCVRLDIELKWAGNPEVTLPPPPPPSFHSSTLTPSDRLGCRLQNSSSQHRAE